MSTFPVNRCHSCSRMHPRSALLSYQRPRRGSARPTTASADRPQLGDARPKQPSWPMLAVMGFQLALVQAATASSLAFAGPSQDAQRLLVLDRGRIEQLLTDEFKDRLHDLSNEQLVSLLDQLLAAKRAAAPDLFSSALAPPAPQQSSGFGFRLFPAKPTLPFLGNSSSSSSSGQPGEQGPTVPGSLLEKLPFWPSSGSSSSSSSSTSSSSGVSSDSGSSSSNNNNATLDSGVEATVAQARTAEATDEDTPASTSNTSGRGGQMPWLTPWNRSAATDDSPDTIIDSSGSSSGTSSAAGQTVVDQQLPGPWWGGSAGGGRDTSSAATDTAATGVNSGTSLSEVGQDNDTEGSSSSSSSDVGATSPLSFLASPSDASTGSSSSGMSSSAPTGGSKDTGGAPSTAPKPAAGSSSSSGSLELTGGEDEDGELDLTQSLLWGPLGVQAGADEDATGSSTVAATSGAADGISSSSSSSRIGSFELPISLPALPRVELPDAGSLREQLEAGQQAVTDRIDQVRQGAVEAWEDAAGGVLPGLVGPLLLVAGAGVGTYALGSLLLSFTAGVEGEAQQEESSSSPPSTAAAGSTSGSQDDTLKQQPQQSKPSLGKLAAMLQQEASVEAAVSPETSDGPTSSSSGGGGADAAPAAAAAAAAGGTLASSEGATATGSDREAGVFSAGARSSSRQREWLLDNADDAEPPIAAASSSGDPLAVGALVGNGSPVQQGVADAAGASGGTSNSASVLWVRDDPPRSTAATAGGAAAQEAGGTILWQSAEVPPSGAPRSQGATILWEREEAPQPSVARVNQQQQQQQQQQQAAGYDTTPSGSGRNGSEQVLWQRPVAAPGERVLWGAWPSEAAAATGANAGAARTPVGPVLWRAAEGGAGAGVLPDAYSSGEADRAVLWQAVGVDPQAGSMRTSSTGNGSDPRVAAGGGSNGRKRLSGVLSNAEDAEQGILWGSSQQEPGSSRDRHHHHQQQQQQGAAHAAAARKPADAKALWPILVAAYDSSGPIAAAAEDPWGTTPLELAPAADQLAGLGLLLQPVGHHGVTDGSSGDPSPAAAVGQPVASPW